MKEEENLIWVCDNDNKIGKDIYGVKMQHFSSIERLNSPQIIIAVASPDGQREVKRELNVLNYLKGKDYWFFA